MKKFLTGILIILLLVLAIFLALKGIKVGNLEIPSIQGLQGKKNSLETLVANATKLASTDYKKAITDVEDNAKKLQSERTNYESLTATADDGTGQQATQIQKYEVEFLWTKLGNHATAEGVNLKIDVTKSTGKIENAYNLNFTAKGSYISITDFISDIENDTSLGFKIEQFKMVPDGDQLTATFTCKEILIKDIEKFVNVSQNNSNNENNNEQNQNNNNTNNNNTNNNNTNNNNTNNNNTNNNNTNSNNTNNTNTNTNNNTNNNSNNSNSGTNLKSEN